MNKNSVGNMQEGFHETTFHNQACLLKVLTADFTVHHQVEQFEEIDIQNSQKRNKQG